MDSDETFDPAEDNPFNFTEDLSLQALALTKFALSLWRDKIYNKFSHRFKICEIWRNSWFDEINKFSCQDVLVVPSRIADLVDNWIELVGDELRIWINNFWSMFAWMYLKQKLSLGKLNEVFLILFDNIVFKSDFTICLETTARYALVNVQLEQESKYKMACEFCLEDWVKQLHPVVKHDLNHLWRSAALEYWHQVMTYKYFVCEQRYIKSLLVESVRKRNRTACEYCWNELFEEWRITNAIYALRWHVDIATIKFLLPKLNRIQTERVCIEFGDRIFGNLAAKNVYFELAMKSWYYMKDFIPRKVFASIVRILWIIVFNHSRSNLTTLDRKNASLFEIWTSASDRLRSHVLVEEEQLQISKLFEELDSEVRGAHSYNLDFMFELLTNANNELRNSIWNRCWLQLIIRAEVWKLQEIMRLCLANEKEIKLFKENRMLNFVEVEEYFNGCVEKGLYEELFDYLNFFVKNRQCLENLSKKIITSNLHFIFLYDEKKVAKFCSFVYQTFRDMRAADKLIQGLILTPQYLEFVHGKLDEGCFHEVINMVRRFPASRKHLIEMKQACLDYYYGNLNRGIFTRFVAPNFNDFLKWCSSSETIISEFKQWLNIEDIFETAVNENQERFIENSIAQELSDFDKFLEWYFGSKEDAKIFKSTAMLHYREKIVLKHALQRGKLGFVIEILVWAFDNDAERIMNFRSTLGR